MNDRTVHDAVGAESPVEQEMAWAEGQPLDPLVARAASAWLVLFMSKGATEAERDAWRHWRAAHPDHERAWRHIEAIDCGVRALPQGVGYQTLAAHARSRRRALKSVAGLLGVGVAGYLGLSHPRVQAWRADLRAGVGTRQRHVLVDGTEIVLNSGSAVDVDFNASQRLLRLLQGEIVVTTGHGPVARGRPLAVRTGEGWVRPLGTRFLVRQHPGRSSVAVFEGSVAITPTGTAATATLAAGQRMDFASHGIGEVSPVPDGLDGWVQGQLAVDDMRLDDFLAELGRHRAGFLWCDERVATLRLSGLFPLDDTDRVLAALPAQLPVRIRTLSRYWVRVEPR